MLVLTLNLALNWLRHDGLCSLPTFCVRLMLVVCAHVEDVVIVMTTSNTDTFSLQMM